MRRSASLAAALAMALFGLSRTSLAGDGICGQAASATLDGFPVYKYCGDTDVWTNNGIDTLASSGGSGWTKTEGGYGYQCVEWAVRYFYFKWNVSRGWFVGYAKDMCGTHPSDVSATTSPVHGDLAIFTPGCSGADATAGHVAAIDTVASSTIGVVQENPAGTMTWPKSCVMCYLHAAGNGGTTDPCATAPLDGAYCGQSTQWGGGMPNWLYNCAGGVTQSKMDCPYGCHLAPFNTNDSCNPAPADAGTTDAAGHDASPSDASLAEAGQAGVDSGSGLVTPPGVDASDSDASWDSSGAPSGQSGGCAVAPAGGEGSPTGAFMLGLALLGLVRLARRNNWSDPRRHHAHPATRLFHHDPRLRPAPVVRRRDARGPAQAQGSQRCSGPG